MENNYPSTSFLRLWFVGGLILAGLILLVTHFGEVERSARLLRQVEPAWLLLALLLQAATYVCVAGVWYLALRQAGATSFTIVTDTVGCRQAVFRPRSHRPVPG